MQDFKKSLVVNFLKPTKFTWFICIIFFILNVSLFVLGFVLEDFGFAEVFFALPVGTIGWLYILVDNLGISVTTGVNLIRGPSLFGWLLLIMGTLSSLFLYYIIASVGNYYYKKI